MIFIYNNFYLKHRLLSIYSYLIIIWSLRNFSISGYGLTECSPVSHLEVSGVKFASIGKPVCGCEARIVDPTTKKDVNGVGQTGELWVRGPHVMKGYYKNQKATDETVIDGWLHTGDVAYYDEDFDFYITDRMKELIKVKGFQVSASFMLLYIFLL